MKELHARYGITEPPPKQSSELKKNKSGQEKIDEKIESVKTVNAKNLSSLEGKTKTSTSRKKNS